MVVNINLLEQREWNDIKYVMHFQFSSTVYGLTTISLVWSLKTWGDGISRGFQQGLKTRTFPKVINKQISRHVIFFDTVRFS
jgi:hypothetical protein